jgi:hypothetical protein
VSQNRAAVHVMLSDAAEATLVKLQRIYDPPGARTEARGAFYALRAQVPPRPHKARRFARHSVTLRNGRLARLHRS